jgi:hypothetical protein
MNSALDKYINMIEEKSFDLTKLPLFLKAVEELAASDLDLQSELEIQDNSVIFIEFPGAQDAPTGYIEIKDGKLTTGLDKPSNLTITVQINPEIAIEFLIGEIDMGALYMAGDMRIIGNFENAMILRSILEAITFMVFSKRNTSSDDVENTITTTTPSISLESIFTDGVNLSELPRDLFDPEEWKRDFGWTEEELIRLIKALVKRNATLRDLENIDHYME